MCVLLHSCHLLSRYSFQTHESRRGRPLQGAFSVAAKAKVKVVPITLIGTGRRMPNKQESRLFPGDVEVVVHPPLGPASAEELLSASREAIRSSLPPEMQPRAA